MSHPKFSVIIPVYNRPGEVRDILESLVAQTRKDFEVIVVEDGSDITCEQVVNAFSTSLPIAYYYKSNAGPGPARNFGFAHARGDYFVVFDSDCILPPAYFERVEQALVTGQLDAWGGPDRAHEKFTVPQRAMAYTMSSLLTTGGIRGGKKRLGWFQPRSFNMGISRAVFLRTQGFAFDRFAEDIEFSIRMKKAGFRSGLITDAFVYHKRRTNFAGFFKQVFNFGRGRVLVGGVHPEEVKLTHWFPSLFTIGMAMLPLLFFVHKKIFIIAAAVYGSYLMLIFLDALYRSRHPGVAALSVISALIQLSSYGLGFLKEKLRDKKSKRRHPAGK